MAYGAYMMDNRGYDLSLFETTRGTAVPKSAPVHKHRKKPQAKNNIIELPEINVSKAQRKKYNPVALCAGFVMSAIAVVAIVSIILGQVRLAELNQEIASAETRLSQTQSLHTQMQAKIEASLSAAAVEEYARNELNMVKATNQQKEYISLSQGDKAEIYDEGNRTVFAEMGDFLSSLWS